MPEPILDTTITTGQAGHEADHDALHAFHNAWIAPDGSRTYVPADFIAGSQPWIALGSLGTSTTFAGDTSLGSWIDLGNISASASLTG